MNTLSLFYGEVCKLHETKATTAEIKHIQRAMCGKCGKHFTNKKGVKQHILRMHINKTKKTDIDTTNKVTGEVVTLEEEVVTATFTDRSSPNPTTESRMLNWTLERENKLIRQLPWIIQKSLNLYLMK